MKYNCPLCSAEMVETLGNQIHPGDAKHGIMLWCPSKECPAQEVCGHGNTVKAAYEIVVQKYKSDDNNNSTKRKKQ